MGAWNITIQGHGCHHNNAPFDVENLVKEFAKTLIANGHTMSVCKVTTGADIDCMPTAAPALGPVGTCAGPGAHGVPGIPGERGTAGHEPGQCGAQGTPGLQGAA
jgi:hypothetical protein